MQDSTWRQRRRAADYHAPNRPRPAERRTDQGAARGPAIAGDGGCASVPVLAAHARGHGQAAARRDAQTPVAFVLPGTYVRRADGRTVDPQLALSGGGPPESERVVGGVR